MGFTDTLKKILLVEEQKKLFKKSVSPLDKARRKLSKSQSLRWAIESAKRPVMGLAAGLVTGGVGGMFAGMYSGAEAGDKRRRQVSANRNIEEQNKRIEQSRGKIDLMTEAYKRRQVRGIPQQGPVSSSPSGFQLENEEERRKQQLMMMLMQQRRV